MARCVSAFDASATSPSTSSLAGLMLVNVPASPSTSLPSIIILGSNVTVGVSAIVLALVLLPLFGRRKPHRQRRQALQYRLRKHPGGEHHGPLRARQGVCPVAHRAVPG